MSMIKIAGKTKDNVTKAICVGENGEPITKKVWTTEMITVFNQSISSNDVISIYENNSIYIGDSALVSLRIFNDLDVDVNFLIYDDTFAGSSDWIRNMKGELLTFDVQANAKRILTAEDIPELQYMQFLKLRIAPKAVPSAEAKLYVYLIKKR